MAPIERCTSAVALIAICAAAPAWEAELLSQEDASCARIAAPAERLACYDRVSPPAPVATDALDAPPAPTDATDDASSRAAVPEPAAATESERAAGVPVVVVGMRKYPGRSALFMTDTGEVWVQIGSEGVYLPEVPFKAELRPASMGTYFLRPSDHGWRVHVRRND